MVTVHAQYHHAHLVHGGILAWGLDSTFLFGKEHQKECIFKKQNKTKKPIHLCKKDISTQNNFLWINYSLLDMLN